MYFAWPYLVFKLSGRVTKPWDQSDPVYSVTVHTSCPTLGDQHLCTHQLPNPGWPASLYTPVAQPWAGSIGTCSLIMLSCCVKATFHHSSQLQTWFSTWFAARFSTSSCGFATRFRLFCRKPGRKPQQVHWFVHVLDKWNVEKPVLSKFAAGFRPACDHVFDEVCSWLE